MYPDSGNRYTEVPDSKLILRIPVSGLENGTYNKTEYILNRTYGSSFDHWVLCGAEEPDAAQISYLKRVAFPLTRKSTLKITREQLIIERTMEADEVYYAELIRSSI